MDKVVLAERRRAFGDQLKATREAQGLSLEALAQSTRISHAFIEALEAGAFEKLPGEVFGRGFVRAMVKTMGLDPAPLIEEFDAAWGGTKAPTSVLKVEIRNKPTSQRGERLKVSFVHARSLLRRGGLGLKIMAPVAGVLALALGLSATGTWSRLASRVRLGSGQTSVTAPEPKPLDVGQQATRGETGQSETAQSEGAGDGSASGQGEQTPLSDNGQVAVVPAGEGDKALTPAAPTPVSEAEVKQEPAAKAEPPPTSVAAKKAEPKPASHQGTTSQATDGEATGPQVLDFEVTDPVRVRLDVDQGPSVTRELAPDTYRFTFKSKADLLIYDASALKITFNGRPLGTLGGKGRVRRLSFRSEATPDKNL